MDRMSVEFLEGEISIVSKYPFRLVIIIISRAFWCFKEVESFENLYNLPSLKKLKPKWKHSLVIHFLLLLHKISGLLKLFTLNQCLDGTDDFFSYNFHVEIWVWVWVEWKLNRMGRSSHKISLYLCCCFGCIDAW